LRIFCLIIKLLKPQPSAARTTRRKPRQSFSVGPQIASSRLGLARLIHLESNQRTEWRGTLAFKGLVYGRAAHTTAVVLAGPLMNSRELAEVSVSQHPDSSSTCTLCDCLLALCLSHNYQTRHSVWHQRRVVLRSGLSPCDCNTCSNVGG
jgi:hypothetical protein